MDEDREACLERAVSGKIGFVDDNGHHFLVTLDELQAILSEVKRSIDVQNGNAEQPPDTAAREEGHNLQVELGADRH